MALGDVRSYTTSEGGIQGQDTFHVLGPIAVGSIIHRIWWTISSSGISVLSFGASLVYSNDTNLANYVSGVVLQVGTNFVLFGGKPGLSVATAAGSSSNVVQAVGVKIGPATGYVLVGWVATVPDFIDAIVSVEIVSGSSKDAGKS